MADPTIDALRACGCPADINILIVNTGVDAKRRGLSPAEAETKEYQVLRDGFSCAVECLTAQKFPKGKSLGWNGIFRYWLTLQEVYKTPVVARYLRELGEHAARAAKKVSPTLVTTSDEPVEDSPNWEGYGL